MPIYPDLAAKLAVVASGLWGIRAATCRLLTKSGVKVAVNQRDGGRTIETGADVAGFVAIEDMRPQVEESGSVEVLVTVVGDCGHYGPTEQMRGEVL